MKAVNESELWKKRLGDWVINPYVSCEHGCFHCYCPAMPGVKFANQGHSHSDNFGERSGVRQFIWPPPRGKSAKYPPRSKPLSI